ncbi:MAG: hypothetical protein FJY97_07520 [candidate division Zixibacteria bacterium]|nr:hypothetical protein [candidate division Zixibacteria bacterium]
MLDLGSFGRDGLIFVTRSETHETGWAIRPAYDSSRMETRRPIVPIGEREARQTLRRHFLTRLAGMRYGHERRSKA